MTDDEIRSRACRAGLAVDWVDAAGETHRVTVESLRTILAALGDGVGAGGGNDPRHPPAMLTAAVGQAPRLPDGTFAGLAELVAEDGRTRDLRLEDGRLPAIEEAGYYKLRYGRFEIDLAIAPPRCLGARDLVPARRPWGIAVQLYGLRREGDGGIGDTTALATLARATAAHGVDALALSPTHSLFPEDPARAGPYSPSSRLFLNPLLADPAVALGERRVGAAGRLEAGEGLIDWDRAGGAKYARLARLFEDFSSTDLATSTPLAGRFRAFVARGGAALAHHASFEAARGGASPTFHEFLQWIADEAFAAAQHAARSAGMGIGLISDLAVGLDRGGSEVAGHPGDYLTGLSVGAPPDLFNPRGQDWGLTSFAPDALLARGFAPFLATLRAALRHAGGVRIDHAMGLMRLWLVPAGGASSDGAYLAYPFDDLLRLLALESHRHRAIVVAEDLGTVPPEFRTRARDAGIAGMDVLWFQREDSPASEARFLAPGKWRREAVAMTTTHDLPTVAGWWSGADLELRRGLGALGESDEAERAGERRALWQAFGAAGIVERPAPAPNETEPVVDAALAFVVQAPDELAIVPLEDLLGAVEQPNLPGTIDKHPNWRRRCPAAADRLLRRPDVERRLGIIARHRGTVG
jgi:4-alpha-glucanotransferase